MTKLDLELVVAEQGVLCLTSCETTATILGIAVGDEFPAAHILADAQEMATLQQAVEELLLKSKSYQQEENRSISFDTLNLVFSAPGIYPTPDRSPLDDVFANPVKAIHVCGELQLACFVHLEVRKQQDASSRAIILLTALEYSRSHRKTYLRQEFGSWLLNEHIESSVIATTLHGTVCFWNRFASELYQYSREEALGQNVMTLLPADLTQEQGMEIMTKLAKGEHWKVNSDNQQNCA
jgi:PAS domain-containing protein